MNILRILMLLLAVWSSARAGEPVALLRSGEQLTYRVSWGMFGDAGELKIAAEAVSLGEGGERLRVTTASSTRGVVRVLYSFDGDAFTLFDPRDGRLLNAAATSRSNKGNTHSSITFDYDKREFSFVDHVRPSRTATKPLPEGTPMDLITALIQTRVWKLKPGESRDALVMASDKFYPLTIKAEGEETIDTPDGPRRTVLLVPRMIGPPQGMFKRGGEVRVWVSTDERSLPLRFEVKLKVGTGVAVLTDYRPPSLE